MKSTIITALLGFASLAVSAPAQLVERQGTLEQVTDSYMFDISIAEFIANRNGKVGPPELNWESNGCTASPDNPFGFDCTFLDPLSSISYVTQYCTVDPIPVANTGHHSHQLLLPPRLRLPQLQTARPFRCDEGAHR